MIAMGVHAQGIRQFLDSSFHGCGKGLVRYLFTPYTLKLKNVYALLSESTTEMCFK